MEQCPCGSLKEFSKCCLPIINNEQKSKSPEQTMRARYSAYVSQNVGFIKSSTHESALADYSEEDVEQWSASAEWEGLSILNTEMIDENSGTVEFVARYTVDRKSVGHHEIATFVKENGDWFFTDGKIINNSVKREGPKVGRNDPCPCGSGKKFKKCCAA